MNLYRKSSALFLYICFINVCVFNDYLCIYGIINNGDADLYWWICGHFYGSDFVKFIHDQFFERWRNVMIIVHNRNTSTWDPGSDETYIFRRQLPTRIRTVQTYVVELPSLMTVHRWPKTLNILSRYKHTHYLLHKTPTQNYFKKILYENLTFEIHPLWLLRVVEG